MGLLILATLAVVTVAPIGLRPISGAPVPVEHFAAFAALSLLLAAGFPRHRRRVLILCLSVAAAFEALQMLEPTRHARSSDLLLKGAGSVVGWMLAQAVTHLPSAVWKRFSASD